MLEAMWRTVLADGVRTTETMISNAILAPKTRLSWRVTSSDCGV